MSRLHGRIITWGSANKETPLSEVRDALREAGLEPWRATDIKNKSAFNRAKAKMKEERVIDEVEDGPNTTVFQFTHKEIIMDGTDKKMKHDYECLLYLDKLSGTITCPEKPELAAKAQALFDHARTVKTSNDITTMVQKMFADNADLYSINQEKGVAYFVPERFFEYAQKVDTFFTKMGGTLAMFPIEKGDEKGDASVKCAVNEGLTSMLKELEEVRDNMSRATRTDTIKRLVKKYNILTHKAECYAEYMSHERDGFLAKLQESKLALVDAVANVATEKAKVEERVEEAMAAE